jgi:hypothetical protein
MYNALTPKSFGARLANIDYRDGDRPMLSRVGFFIEDVGDVARRNGTSEVRAGERIPLAWLSPADGARYGLFQHMLANHDWSMRAGPPGDSCCHNAKLIGTAAPGQTVPVPYDFDYSGFVDAPYAEPPSQLRLSNVRQRQYRGYCAHSPQGLEAAREMVAARPRMVAAITQTPGLSTRLQSSAIAFIDKFYAEIASDSGTAAVLRKCVN